MLLPYVRAPFIRESAIGTQHHGASTMWTDKAIEYCNNSLKFFLDKMHYASPEGYRKTRHECLFEIIVSN